MFTVKTGNRILIGYAILLSCGIAIALVFQARFYPELGYDESASVLGLSILSGHFGNHIDPMGPLGFDRHFVMDCFPPVYFLVQAIIFKLFGFSIFAARAASALFVGATALLCFWGAKRVAGPAAGYVAMAIYLIVPLQIYTLVARPDVAVPFFLLASLLILGFITEAQTKRWQFALAGLLFSLAVLSHFVALMAGPVVAALLWRQSGRGKVSFWRASGFYAFLLGFVVPMAFYAVLLHPYQISTIQHLTNYANVGLKSTPASVLDHWPLRPTLQHLELHQSYLPWIILCMLPLSATVAIAGFKFPAYRARLTTAGWLLALSFPGLWFMVGTYPNIAIYGYYGPVYLSLGAVVLGYSLLSPFPRNWLDKPLFIAVCAAMATMMTYSLAAKAWHTSNIYRNIPISSSLAWTAEFPQLQETKVLATPHWVFSSADDRVRTYTLLRFYEDVPALSRLYQSSVPGSGTLSDYGTAIFDKYNETHVLQQLVNYASLRPTGSIADSDPNKTLVAEKIKQRLKPENRDIKLSPYAPFTALLSNSYRIVGLHNDDQRISADYAVLAVADKTIRDAGEWPKMAIPTTTGPVNLTVMPPCSVSLPGSLLPPTENWAPWLTTYALPLEGTLETKDILLAVRIVTNTREHRLKPLGFAAYFPTIEKAGTARRELAAYRAPPAEADVSFGLMGFALRNGEVGREMLIRPGGENSGSVLTIHQTEPATIDRIDIAFALPPHRKCDEILASALKNMLVNATRQPKPYVTSVLNGTISGTPITINLSAKATGEAVIWRSGRLVGRHGFRDMSAINIPIPVPGQYGIEVWFDGDSPSKKRRVEAVFPSVADKS